MVHAQSLVRKRQRRCYRSDNRSVFFRMSLFCVRVPVENLEVSERKQVRWCRVQTPIYLLLDSRLTNWILLPSYNPGIEHPARIRVYDRGIILCHMHFFARGLDSAVLRREPQEFSTRRVWIVSNCAQGDAYRFFLAVNLQGAICSFHGMQVLDGPGCACSLDLTASCSFVLPWSGLFERETT